ncbi:MAG: hypothetical protein ACFE7R_03540 [Candidatus Hodarchaeota archaeon]
MSEIIDATKIRHIMFLGIDGGELLLYVPYDGTTEVNHDMRAALLRAIMQFSDDAITTIRWSNSVYMFEKGDICIGLMGMTSVPDTREYRDKLVKLLHGFEREYKRSMGTDIGDIRRYKNYALEVIEEIPLVNISLDATPRCLEEGALIPWRVGEVDVKLEILQQLLNGTRTIKEISEMTQIPLSEVIALTSILAYFGWVEL